MRNMFRAAVVGIVMACTAPVAAGPFEEGVAASESGDYATALKLWRPLAEQDVDAAQYNLGQMYLNGWGVPKDYAEAVKWFRKAADQGISNAQYNLGVLYDEGQGVPQDYVEAVRWYRKAAAQGDANAQFNLGLIYAKGNGVTQDYAEAVRWYRKAANQGIAKAQFNLGFIYDDGHGITQDYAEAVRWYRKAADQGNAVAQYNLGNMYRQSQGVPQDYAEAAKWYLKAAEQGNALAQSNLGVMFGIGQGVLQDYVESHKWANLAAAQGDANATNLRNTIAKLMTPAQIAEAQKLARDASVRIEETPGYVAELRNSIEEGTANEQTVMTAANNRLISTTTVASLFSRLNAKEMTQKALRELPSEDHRAKFGQQYTEIGNTLLGTNKEGIEGIINSKLGQGARTKAWLAMQEYEAVMLSWSAENPQSSYLDFRNMSSKTAYEIISDPKYQLTDGAASTPNEAPRPAGAGTNPYSNTETK